MTPERYKEVGQLYRAALEVEPERRAAFLVEACGGDETLWREVELGRKVALKLLPADLTAEPERVRRFEQEARAASALNHPNLERVFAFVKLTSESDIGGDKYRLISKINYGEDIQVVDIQEALTHAEYNKDKWKRNCQ